MSKYQEVHGTTEARRTINKRTIAIFFKVFISNSSLYCLNMTSYYVIHLYI